MSEKLSKLLECPICFNTLTLPVALCQKNGHVICGICRNSVNICPYCKSQWSVNRNILVEQLLQALLDRCRFCNQYIKYGSKEEHESTLCKKMAIQCFIFSRNGRCPCFSPKDCLWIHLYEKHGRKVWRINLNENTPVPIKNVFWNKNFAVLYEVRVSSYRHSILLVLRVFGDKMRKLFFISANILNADEEGLEQFLFTFAIWRKNRETCSLTGPCLPISQIPKSPDRFPGGHPTGRVIVPKTNYIFSDPEDDMYRFCLKIKRP